MARIQWHGQSFIATPIQQLNDNEWLMRAEEHGARFSPGTVIHVKKNEIIEMAAAEAPPSPTESLAALERAMAEERKTLPTVAELLAKAAAEAKAPA